MNTSRDRELAFSMWLSILIQTLFGGELKSATPNLLPIGFDLEATLSKAASFFPGQSFKYSRKVLIGSSYLLFFWLFIYSSFNGCLDALVSGSPYYLLILL